MAWLKFVFNLPLVDRLLQRVTGVLYWRPYCHYIRLALSAWRAPPLFVLTESRTMDIIWPFTSCRTVALLAWTGSFVLLITSIFWGWDDALKFAELGLNPPPLTPNWPAEEAELTESVGFELKKAEPNPLITWVASCISSYMPDPNRKMPMPMPRCASKIWLTKCTRQLRHKP